MVFWSKKVLFCTSAAPTGTVASQVKVLRPDDDCRPQKYIEHINCGQPLCVLFVKFVLFKLNCKQFQNEIQKLEHNSILPCGFFNYVHLFSILGRTTRIRLSYSILSNIE